jgi:hypothetical protein
LGLGGTSVNHIKREFGKFTVLCPLQNTGQFNFQVVPKYIKRDICFVSQGMFTYRKMRMRVLFTVVLHEMKQARVKLRNTFVGFTTPPPDGLLKRVALNTEGTWT